MRNKLGFIGVLLALVLLIGFYGPVSQGDDRDGSSVGNLVGNWREHWGIPGETDVTYNDRYRVWRGTDGKVNVEITSRNQRIWDVDVSNGVLTFKQRTDAFVVQYRMHLPGDQRWMIGSATTPRGKYPIIWAMVN